MMSARWAALDLLKIKVPQSKGYDVKILIHDVTSMILSHDSKYLVDVAMRSKFNNSGISMRNVTTTSIF